MTLSWSPPLSESQFPHLSRRLMIPYSWNDLSIAPSTSWRLEKLPSAAPPPHTPAEGKGVPDHHYSLTTEVIPCLKLFINLSSDQDISIVLGRWAWVQETALEQQASDVRDWAETAKQWWGMWPGKQTAWVQIPALTPWAIGKLQYFL